MTDTTVTPARPRPTPRALEVLEVGDVSPSYRRVRFAAPELVGVDLGAALTIKLRFPSPHPEGRPHGRPLTLINFDQATGQFDVDFVLHEHDGVAVNWAKSAAPGMGLEMFGPRGGGDALPEGARHVVLAGDATALPAIQALVGRLAPEARADVLVEVPTAADARAFDSRAALNVEWLVPDDNDPRPLRRALRKLPVEDVDFWWVACELGAAREIRAHLTDERGVGAERLRVTPYWRAGMDEDAFHDERHKEMDRHR